MNSNRFFSICMVLALVVTSFAVSQPVAAQGSARFTARINPGAQTAPGEVVVAFADSEGKNLVEKIEQAVETANTTDGEVARLSLDGNAVIRVDGDPAAAAAELNDQPGVLYAEPNYIYSVPKQQGTDDGFSPSSEYVYQQVTPSSGTNWKSVMAVPSSTIQGMVALGTYPTDTYLTSNQGWFAVGADIVWPNATKSANICEVDTGVDSNHPDLKSKSGKTTVYNIIKGYDFVNADASPDDDNGHGTHVAGIMVAVKNNKIGISGISTGKVVAVKALDAQGVGTNFDIAEAIKYCANRTDIRVINLSLGGPDDSTAIYNAVMYATATKGKLVVAAAGNENSTTPVYPAGYADEVTFPDFPENSILSVGATGIPEGEEIRYECRWTQSNYGDWVNVSAPGLEIYSTTPYDIPFYQNYYGAINTRYDYMSGTSMAAAFVSAAAARRMGYKPSETNVQVGTAILDTGDPLDDTCTVNEMLQAKKVNVATLMDRAGVRASVFDAASGVPLNGAQVSVTYLDAGTAASKVSTITPNAYKEVLGVDLDPNRLFTYYFPVTDILDIPTKDKNGNTIFNYVPKVNKSGYTTSYQPAFQQDSLATLTPGTFAVITNGAVPPKSADFNVVLGWHKWQQAGYEEAVNAQDLDLYVWLPDKNGVLPTPGQPDNFIVGYGGDAFGAAVGDPYGTLVAFPYARLKREGGYLDGGPTIEMSTILRRAANAPYVPAPSLPVNNAVPYYTGAYTIMVTDYGQIIDHDGDGCGDNYGYNYNSSYTPGAECAGKTAGIPLLGAYFTPYIYVWKDGAVKFFIDGSNNFGPFPANADCNEHWWKAFEIKTIETDTAPTYNTVFSPDPTTCDDGAQPNFIPYVGYSDIPGDRITISGLGK
ncbi:MAG: S8 family serine peptidase [Chloroflexi bacterium]|nr:S8 family serine peptidase [Chloroflexota bacterium]